MKRQKKNKVKKKKDGSITAAAKKIIGKSKSTLNKTKKARAATSSRKDNRNSKSSAVGKRLIQPGKSVGKVVAKKGAAKKKKKKKAKSKKQSDDDTAGGGGFFLAADDGDDDDNPFLQQEILTPEELEMRKAAEEQREMTERFKMATEDLLTSERTLSKEVVEENAPHERLAVGCQVMAQYGGKEKWFPGHIATVNDDFTYDIEYDDGEKESNVSLSRIEVVEKVIIPRHTPRTQAELDKYACGVEEEAVEAAYRFVKEGNVVRTSQGDESVAWPQPGNFYCSWGVEWKSLRRLTFRWMRNALPLASENAELYSRVKILLGSSRLWGREAVFAQRREGEAPELQVLKKLSSPHVSNMVITAQQTFREQLWGKRIGHLGETTGAVKDIVWRLDSPDVGAVPSMLDAMCGKILGNKFRADKIVAGGEFKPAYVWALIYLAVSVRQWWSDNLNAVAHEVGGKLGDISVITFNTIVARCLDEYLDAGYPRAAKAVDMLRANIVFESPEQLRQAYELLTSRFYVLAVENTFRGDFMPKYRPDVVNRDISCTLCFDVADTLWAQILQSNETKQAWSSWEANTKAEKGDEIWARHLPDITKAKTALLDCDDLLFAQSRFSGCCRLQLKFYHDLKREYYLWHKIHEAKNPAELFRHFHNLRKVKTVVKKVKAAVGVIAAFKNARAANTDGAKVLTDSTALPSGSGDESNLGSDREDSGDAIALNGDDENGANDEIATAAEQSSAGDVVGGS